MAKELHDVIASEFKRTKEEVDFLMWMKKIFVDMIEKKSWSAFMLTARLGTLNKKLEENSAKFPALRKLFNKEFIQKISESNHAKVGFGVDAVEASFASHNEDSIKRTLKQLVNTIELCLLTEAIVQSNADLIIISAGCGSEEEQRHPTYAKALAVNKKVLILNTDPEFIQDMPVNSTFKNTQIIYFGAPFGHLGKFDELVMRNHTEVLLQPFVGAMLFCKEVLEQILSNSKQHIILQSFFGPGLDITPLAHHLGIQFNNKIGMQLEIIGGYDAETPIILHSKEYFLLHKQKLEEAEKPLIELAKKIELLKKDIENLNTQQVALKHGGDQSKLSSEEQKKLDDQTKEQGFKLGQFWKEKERLEKEKRNVESDIGQILAKYGDREARKLPETCAKAAKEIAELHYGKLCFRLEKLEATELFKASPSLHEKAAIVEAYKPKPKSKP